MNMHKISYLILTATSKLFQLYLRRLRLTYVLCVCMCIQKCTVCMYVCIYHTHSHTYTHVRMYMFVSAHTHPLTSCSSTTKRLASLIPSFPVSIPSCTCLCNSSTRFSKVSARRWACVHTATVTVTASSDNRQ